MKKIKFFSIILIALVLAGCKVSKSIRMVKENTNNLLSEQDLSLHKEIQLFDSLEVRTVPSFETWSSDREEFISMIKQYTEKNQIVRVKSNNAGTSFVIGGTVVGVGGGIYGLFSSSEPKGAAITSMVTGALTALVGSLNLQKKAERANVCAEFLDAILLDFQAYWGVARYPRNEAEFVNYLRAKDEIIERLKSMKCFGTPLSS